MKVAIIYNKDLSGVINVFGMQNKEVYNPETVKKVADFLESCGHNVEVIDGNMKVIEQLQQFMPNGSGLFESRTPRVGTPRPLQVP